MSVANAPKEMCAQLQECLNTLSESGDEIVALISSLDEKQLHWRADDASWSVCDCVEHLIISATTAAAVQEAAIDSAKRRERFGQGPFRYSYFGRKFLDILAPPPGRRFKAPKVFQPSSEKTHTKDSLLNEFKDSQERAQNIVRSASGLDLTRVKVQSPVSKMIRFNLGVSLLVTPTHQKRHYWQMQRTMEHRDFPAVTG